MFRRWASLGEGCSSLWFSQFMSTKNVTSLKSCKCWNFHWICEIHLEGMVTFISLPCIDVFSMWDIQCLELSSIFSRASCPCKTLCPYKSFKLMLPENCCLTIISLMNAFSCLLQRSASGDPLQTKYPWVACSSCHSLTWNLVLFLLILFCS